jgi:hypothetical protein
VRHGPESEWISWVSSCAWVCAIVLSFGVGGGTETAHESVINLRSSLAKKVRRNRVTSFVTVTGFVHIQVLDGKVCRI